MDIDTDHRPATDRPPGRRPTNADPAQLAQRLRDQIVPEERLILGLAGPPGTGKSLFADHLAAALYPLSCAVVPLDGFHLGSKIINGTPLQHRKGAIDTFDAGGYAALLQRLHTRDEAVVYAPFYDRTLEEPIAGSIAVDQATQLVITEGNYLLVDDGDWGRARALMNQVWFVDTEHALRIERLTARHIQFGKTPEAARAWVHASDEVNAAVVLSTKEHADLVVTWN